MKITQSIPEIRRIIDKELQAHFKDVLTQVRSNIQTRIQALVISKIKSQPEYDSLLHGRLQGEFGLTDPASKLDAILNVWSQDIRSRLTDKKFVIEMIRSDFSNVLSMPEAKQLTAKGEYLDWLEWLSMFGDRTIIREYEIGIAGTYNSSRTGFAVMLKNKSGQWGVPQQYAGTIDNNWVTRAIDRDLSDDEIADILVKEIENKW